jgi:hypothetical protein
MRSSMKVDGQGRTCSWKYTKMARKSSGFPGVLADGIWPFERRPSENLRFPSIAVYQENEALQVEFLKIVVVSILAAVLYGIVHDQVTARICLQNFTVFHPPIFHTETPTLLALV